VTNTGTDPFDLAKRAQAEQQALAEQKQAAAEVG